LGSFQLYVIWTGEQNGDEAVLKETALLTGGAFYDMEMNSVIRTRMLRIEMLTSTRYGMTTTNPNVGHSPKAFHWQHPNYFWPIK